MEIFFGRDYFMAVERNVLIGILAIILGLLVIAFPLVSIFTLSVLTGIGIIFIGIWLLLQSFKIWSSSKGLSIAALILGIIGIVVGIGLFGKILAFSIFIGIAIYIGGLFLIIAGIIGLISGLLTEEGPVSKSGFFGIILGALYMVIGVYALNPLYLAALIGIFLIITGIFEIFDRQK